MLNSAALPISHTTSIPAQPLHLAAFHSHIFPETLSPAGDTRWGRLLCEWHEKKNNGILSHIYAASIDGRDGGIYFDCRPSKIFAKCFAQLIVRPFFTIAKTIYHISLYPIFCEISALYYKQQSLQATFTNSVRAVADIIRTPLYGLILTVTTVAVLIAGTINPLRLYEGRKILGQIEQDANWGQIHTSWTLADCFQPFPLGILEEYAQKDYTDTYYTNLNTVEKSLANFGRACIRSQRRRFDIFSCQQLDPQTAYYSPILSTYNGTPRSSKS